MVNVTCLFIFYLLLDSAEGIIVFYRRDAWGPLKIVLYYFNYTIFLFTIIAGISLYLPLFYFLAFMGFETEEYLAHTWIIFAGIVFLLALIFGWATQSNWGNIQNLAPRFSFLLLYCFQYIPWWGIIFSLISMACILGIEIKKCHWSWHELRKKDWRFRHHEKT